MVRDLDHVAVMWEARRRIVAFVLLAAFVAFVLGRLGADGHAARATIQLTTASAQAGANALQPDAVFLARSYAELVSSSAVLARAAESLGEEADALRGRVSADASGVLGFIDVRANGDSSDQAVARTNAVAMALVDEANSRNIAARDASLETLRLQITATRQSLAALPDDSLERRTLESELASLTQVVADRVARPVDRLVVVREPALDSRNPWQRATMLAVLAGLGALIVGAEGAVLLDRRRGGQISLRNLREYARARAVSLVSIDGDPRDRVSLNVEDYAALRTSLRHGAAEKASVFAVVGVSPADATARVAWGLGLSLSRLGGLVTVVDAGSTGALHSQSGALAYPGLFDTIGSGAPIASACQRAVGFDNVFVVSHGLAESDPSARLAGGALRRVIESIIAESVDSSVVVLSASRSENRALHDTALSESGALVALVVDLQRDDRRSLQDALDALDALGVPPTVLCALVPAGRGGR